jgi:hypothetical protein
MFWDESLRGAKIYILYNMSSVCAYQGINRNYEKKSSTCKLIYKYIYTNEILSRHESPFQIYFCINNLDLIMKYEHVSFVSILLGWSKGGGKKDLRLIIHFPLSVNSLQNIKQCFSCCVLSLYVDQSTKLYKHL